MVRLLWAAGLRLPPSWSRVPDDLHRPQWAEELTRMVSPSEGPSPIIDASLKKSPPSSHSFLLSHSLCSFSCSLLLDFFFGFLLVCSLPLFSPILPNVHSCCKKMLTLGLLLMLERNFIFFSAVSFLQIHPKCFFLLKSSRVMGTMTTSLHFQWFLFLSFFYYLQGPRPPSDPHGRYAENKHMSGMGESITPFVVFLLANIQILLLVYCRFCNLHFTNFLRLQNCLSILTVNKHSWGIDVCGLNFSSSFTLTWKMCTLGLFYSSSSL